MWQAILFGSAGLTVLAFAARGLYGRLYLRRRLFIEPFTNLSRNRHFNTGQAFAELLIFEIERVHRLLHRARHEEALWSEQVALPLMERSADGYARLMEDAQLLGFPGRLNKLVGFVLHARPQMLRGNIQRYGTDLRLQVRLDGMARADEPPVRAWTTTFDANQPQLIPAALSDLAHQVLRDLCQVQGFKSPEAFRAFTTALHHHLDHSSVSSSNAFEAAQREYRLAMAHDGTNALAACNLGDLLYAQYSFKSNELAIEAFLNALNTDNLGVRARAFRGLANAYCQKYQRYRYREATILDKAIHAANAAGRLCGHVTGALTDREIASIKKAQAYAQQVSAEQAGVSAEHRDGALNRAVALYEEATRKNRAFAAAYNNLGYLYLDRAKRLHMSGGTSGNGERTHELMTMLSDAEKHCAAAIAGERTFYIAYDNRGNIARLRARLDEPRAVDLLEHAIEAFHESLSYRPSYGAAWSDLAKAHVQLYFLLGDGRGRGHGELAWHYHWESLGCVTDDDGRRVACEDFAKRRRPTRPEAAGPHASACRCLDEGAAP